MKPLYLHKTIIFIISGVFFLSTLTHSAYAHSIHVCERVFAPLPVEPPNLLNPVLQLAVTALSFPATSAKAGFPISSFTAYRCSKCLKYSTSLNCSQCQTGLSIIDDDRLSLAYSDLSPINPHCSSIP
jgi:hypothetical protein